MIELRQLIERFQTEMARAGAAGAFEPTAASLATTAGRPSVRVVLLKEVDTRGFVFYTNLESRKAHELAVNPWAALCFWWAPIATQVMVEGWVELVTEAEADVYFAGRDRGKQVGAWASRQSAVLSSRQELLDRVAAADAKYRGKEVPRPAYWSGYRLIPDRLEFWYGREDRLHERFEYRLERGVWVERILSP